MKKVISIASILFVAVISTACINNLAVQDLNNKAKAYAEKGDYAQAIERLKSGIDLDPSIFETHYNLAVVYTQAEDYLNAINEYKTVITMKPDFADSYYALGTAENNLAIEIKKGHVRINESGNLEAVQATEEQTVELTEEEISIINDLYSSAIKNYEKYLELKPKAEDKKEVKESIARINGYLTNETQEEQSAE